MCSLTCRAAKAKTDCHANGVVFQMQIICTDVKCVEPVATMGCCSRQQSSHVIRLAVLTKKMIEFCVDDSFIPLSLIVDVRVNWWLYAVADTSRQAFFKHVIID